MNGFYGDLAENVFSEIGKYPRTRTYQRFTGSSCVSDLLLMLWTLRFSMKHICMGFISGINNHKAIYIGHSLQNTREVLLYMFHFNLQPFAEHENVLKICNQRTISLAMGGIIEQGLRSVFGRKNIKCVFCLRDLETHCKRPYSNRLSRRLLK